MASNLQHAHHSPSAPIPSLLHQLSALPPIHHNRPHPQRPSVTALLPAPVNPPAPILQLQDPSHRQTRIPSLSVHAHR